MQKRMLGIRCRAAAAIGIYAVLGRGRAVDLPRFAETMESVMCGFCAGACTRVLQYMYLASGE